MTKKPKKDEIVPFDGVVEDVTDTLIVISGKKIAVIGGATKEKIRDLNIKSQDSVHITYQNGILLTIEPVTQGKKPENTTYAGTDDCSLPDKTAVHQIELPSETVTSTGCSGDGRAKTEPVHIQVSAENIASLLAGKNIEDICKIRDEIERFAKIELLKDNIRSFDEDRAKGAIISVMEVTAIGGSNYDGDDERLRYGDRIDYRVTLITPATDEEIAKYKGWENERAGFGNEQVP